MFKRKINRFSLILACLASPLMAQSVLVSIQGATVDGYTSDIEVPIIISNPSNEVSGVQFDLEVSPGDVVSLSNVEALSDADGFSTSFNEIFDNNYRVILYNAGGTSTIPANSDTIMALHFDGSSVVSSQLDLVISNVIVSDASGLTIASSGSDGSITIGEVVSLSASSGQGDIDETVSLTVDMENGGSVGGVQFDIYDSPDYVTITEISTTTRTDGFTVSSTEMGHGTRILIYDDSGNNIAGGTGSILDIDFQIHSDAYAGDVALTFEDVVVTDEIGGIYWIATLDTGFVNVFPGYMEEPHNLVATSGLDAMVSLAWDAPYGPVGSDIEEDFEEGVIPEDWTMTTNSAVGWFVTQDGSSQYWSVPTHTWYACSNDDAADDDGSVDYLITPPLNTNGATDFQLSFASYYDGAYGQTAHILVSTDGTTYTEVYSLPTNTAWVTETVDLNDYAGEPELYIAFHSNDNGAWASGWAIDDIMISFTGGRIARNIHYDFNELGQWVITAEKAEVIERFPDGILYQQLVDWENPLEPQNINRDVPVNAYKIYRTTDGVNFDLVETVGSDVLTYNDEDVDNGTTYYYYITADYSPDGTESGASNIVEATPVEWIELELSDGAALSGSTDTLDILVNNESDVSFFYFEIADNPDILEAIDILATDRTSNWSLDVSEVGGQMVITGLGLGNNMSPGSEAVCRVVVLAASQDPAMVDMEITTAAVQDANGNNMIWTAEGSIFDVSVETQYLVLPNGYGDPNSLVTLPLVISNTKDVYGVQVYLTDDMGSLTGVTVQGTDYHDFSDWTVQGNMVANDFRILLFNNSLDNPLPQGSGHIADIVYQVNPSAATGNTVNVAMSEVVVVDENNIPMHVELFESKVFIGEPAAIYSIGSVDQSAQTFTIEMENTDPVYVVELGLGDAPEGIEITDVSSAGRFNGSIDGQSGEMEDGSGYVLAYDLASGISAGSGEILEVSYDVKLNTGFVGDVITWIEEANSADANLNSLSSGSHGYAVLDADLSINGPVVLPTRITLHPAFPNPFNPMTQIRYELPEASFVDLRIFDLNGREIKTLFRGFDASGFRSVMWDAKDDHGQNVSAGVYLYRLEAAGQAQSQKLIYLK